MSFYLILDHVRPLTQNAVSHLRRVNGGTVPNRIHITSNVFSDLTEIGNIIIENRCSVDCAGGWRYVDTNHNPHDVGRVELVLEADQFWRLFRENRPVVSDIDPNYIRELSEETEPKKTEKTTGRKKHGELKANHNRLIKQIAQLRKYLENIDVPTIRKMAGYISKLTETDKNCMIKILRYFEDGSNGLKLTFDADSQDFSYSSTDKKEYLWKSRRKASFQKMVNKLLSKINKKIDLPDVPDGYVIDGLGNIVVGFLSHVKFEYLKGSSIVDAYENEVGGHSCMTGNCSEYTEVYARNPNVVKMLTAKFNCGDSARCLIWKTDEGVTVGDRIYSQDPALYFPIIRELKKQGIRLRKHNQYGEGNEYYGDRFSVSVDIEDIEYIPYMDTFLACDDPDGDEVTLHQKSSRYDHSLTETGGDLPWDGGSSCRCCYCEDRIDRDYAMIDPDGDYSCEDCYHERFSNCEDCGECVSNGDVIAVQNGNGCADYLCDYCAQRDADQCCDCGDHYRNDCIVVTIDTDEAICQDCAEGLYVDEDGELCRNEPVLADEG